MVLLPGGNAGGGKGTSVPEIEEVSHARPIALSPDRFRREFGVFAHLLESFCARSDADAHALHDLAIGDVIARLTHGCCFDAKKALGCGELSCRLR